MNIKKSTKQKKQSGFTIVELMIATVIFSLVLLGAMVALIQISKLYYKGVTNARTQDLNRNVMAEISQGIQFSRSDINQVPPGSPGPIVANPAAPSDPDVASRGYFCNGPRRYTYIIDRKLSQTPDTNPNATLRKKVSRHVLWVDTPAACNGPADLSNSNPCAPTACIDGVELMSEGARLTKLTLGQPNVIKPDLWSISISVAYGDDDLLVDDGTGTRYACEGASNFSEFCAISELSTTVLRRL
jgi:prepilin-type N-terminal cleavage/methylation domain-containing protein